MKIFISTSSVHALPALFECALSGGAMRSAHSLTDCVFHGYDGAKNAVISGRHSSGFPSVFVVKLDSATAGHVVADSILSRGQSIRNARTKAKYAVDQRLTSYWSSTNPNRDYHLVTIEPVQVKIKEVAISLKNLQPRQLFRDAEVWLAEQRITDDMRGDPKVTNRILADVEGPLAVVLLLLTGDTEAAAEEAQDLGIKIGA